MTDARAEHLITADALAARLRSGAPTSIIDVRWRLDLPDGRDEHRRGHIPGAVYADMDTQLSEHGAPADGRHPLPSRERLQAALTAWGVDEGDEVVVVDDHGSIAAARAWWLLRWAGLTRVRVLDGALAAWRDAGYELETGEVVPRPGTARIESVGHLPTIDADGAAALAEAGVLIDARAAARYRGDVEPVDPVAGHIPGAVNVPAGEHTDASGRVLPTEALRARFAEVGVDDGIEVGVYCGSGVSAASHVLALTIAGWSPALYPGSWSAWSNTPGRPIATGPEPRGRMRDDGGHDTDE